MCASRIQNSGHNTLHSGTCESCFLFSAKLDSQLIGRYMLRKLSPTGKSSVVWGVPCSGACIVPHRVSRAFVHRVLCCWPPSCCPSCFHLTGCWLAGFSGWLAVHEVVITGRFNLSFFAPGGHQPDRGVTHDQIDEGVSACP